MKREKQVKRVQTIGEEIANSISHGLMALFGIYALIALLLKSDNGWKVASSLIFGLSIIILYSMSTLYHALAFTRSKNLFKRFDHLSIYLLIGGTFAPNLLLLPSLRENPMFGIDGFLDKGLFLFICQWVLIIFGVVIKSIWVKKYQALHVAIFLLIGWSGLYFIVDLYHFEPAAMYLILFGGVSYSIGVIFYSLSSKKYFHFIWHIWVALGTVLQFLAIYTYLMR